MLKCPCHHCKKRELIKERVKNNWRYADKALKLIGDDKNA